MAGGGAKGAFQAGAMWELVNQLSPIEVAYDVVSGISVGAINAGALSIFAKGDEKTATDFLIDKWMNMTSANMWQYWPKGIYDSLFTESSLLDSSPLRNFISGVIGEKQF